MRFNLTTAAIGLLIALGAAGCADQVFVGHGYDNITGVTYTNVKSALDGAGGPRQDLLVATDPNSKLLGSWYASGLGTWQTATEGAVGAAVSAIATFGAAAVLRPAQTNVSNNSTTSGGSVGSGAAEATASPVNTATGGIGRGGAGWNAAGGNATGGNATGGTATASPVVTANPSATANPRVTASGTGYGGTASAQAGASASNVNKNSNAIHNTNQQRQGQNQNQGPQWNCTNSPPCN